MTPDEIKLRITTYANNMVEKIFDKNEIFGPIKIATAKYWIKQNVWKVGNILSNFVDENGDINTDDFIEIYSNELFDGDGKYTVDIQQITSNEQLNKFLPNKLVVFTKQDLNNLFEISKKINDINDVETTA